jgi:hypothetical protein
MEVRSHVIREKTFYFINAVLSPGAHPEFFIMGAEPEAIYNLCLILKIHVIKSCKYNITLSATAFIYIQT